MSYAVDYAVGGVVFLDLHPGCSTIHPFVDRIRSGHRRDVEHITETDSFYCEGF